MVDWEGFYGALRRPDFVRGYEIQNHLGGGAFGEVYKARKHSIGKAYAIKFLKLDDGEHRGAIERELEQVRLFAAIDHPNLVTIEDMGLVRGVPYLIMGYAGEETLRRVLERRSLPAEGALRYFVQICRGVQALHDRRLAHFDLKPGNVFIKGDVARVGDYGLAKLITRGSQTLSFGRGTPHYMAPEMLRNRADHRADVYSLGVILFECLAQRVPFEGGGGEGGERGPIVREDDQAPDFPGGFPPLVKQVVEGCLRVRPEDRYASVRDLLGDLGQTAGSADELDLSELGLAAGDVGASSAAQAARQEDSVGAEVVSFQPLTDPPAPKTADTEASESARRRPAWVASETPEPPSQRFTLSAPYGPDGGTGTVPVPPRADGGIVGTLVAGLGLGAEILGALLTGPVLYVVRVALGWGDRSLRGVPGVIGALLKLWLMLIVFALLGAVAALVALAGVWFWRA